MLEYSSQPETMRDYRSNFMDQNYVFPANFAQVMTDHAYIHTVIPTGVDSWVFQCMTLTPEESTTEKAERHYHKNHDVVRVVFDEDFAIGEGNQQGLATGANKHFTFGRYECGLHLGQRSIDAALADELRL